MKTDNIIQRNGYVFYLYVALFIEIAFLTFGKKGISNMISPIILFAASIFISIFPLYTISQKEEDYSTIGFKSIFKDKIIWIIYFIGSLILYLDFKTIILDYKINVHYSDVIPHAEILAKRFLAGEQPYKPITEFGYPFFPSYMPLHWLPLCISLIFNFDPRWMSYIMLIIGLFFYEWFIISDRKNENSIVKIINSALPFILLKILIKTEINIFALTIESIIAGFYMILCFSIFSKSTIVRGIGIALGILTRYSLLFWIPCYFAILSFFEKKSNAFKIGLSALIIILSLYILPFFIKDPSIFTKGQENYKSGILGEWHLKSFQAPTEQPYSIFRGIGFACYFYEFVPGNDLLHKIEINKLFLIICSSLGSLLFSYLVYIHKSKIKNPQFVSLLSLKFICTIFFTFIMVPYSYLYLTSMFISLFIIAGSNYKTVRSIEKQPLFVA